MMWVKSFLILCGADNPLAGGILTGRYSYDDTKTAPTGRFFGNSWAVKYRERFWHKCLFDTVDAVKNALSQVCVASRLRRAGLTVGRWSRRTPMVPWESWKLRFDG